jgi:hypothetical protein
MINSLATPFLDPDQLRVPQDFQVLRNSRLADRHSRNQFRYGTGALPETFEQLAAGGIT